MTAIYPPGPRQRPLVGSAPEFRRDPLAFLLASRAYGDIVHVRLGPRHAYILNHPEPIRAVLVDQAERFHKTPLFKKHTRRSIGQGLLTSEGELHRRQRRLVQPAFHHQRIARYAGEMVDETLQLLDQWRDGETRDLHRDMTRLTMDIVSRTLFGADVSGQAAAIEAAITAGMRSVLRRTTNPLTPPEWIPTPQNLKDRAHAALMERVIMGFIEERRASGEDRGDLLSMLLLAVDEESHDGMSDRQARDEVMTLFIAGHETTANALTWTLMLLAQHTAVAETLHAEVDSVLQGRAPTMSDLPSLPYTEMVVKESLRLYPPAWIIGRMATETVHVGGYTLAPRSIVLISPYVLHRDPRFFPDPDRFMPERFATDVESSIPRYTYFPFGGGPRICIGNAFAMMEARLILATIVHRWRLALEPGQDFTPEPLITLRPRHGLRMRLAARRDTPERRQVDPLNAPLAR